MTPLQLFLKFLQATDMLASKENADGSITLVGKVPEQSRKEFPVKANPKDFFFEMTISPRRLSILELEPAQACVRAAYLTRSRGDRHPDPVGEEVHPAK